MDFIETQGIIFRVVKYSETSIICDIYTRDKGLSSYIVSGVRSTKSGQKAAIYKPMNLVNVVAYDHNIEKLNRIKEICLAYHYQKLNFDVLFSSMAIFIMEVCRNAIKEREANYPLYDFIHSRFISLDESLQMNPNTHLSFLAELSVFLGFAPMDNYSDANPYFNLLEGVYVESDNTDVFVLDREMSYLFYQICKYGQSNPEMIQTTRSQRNQLTEFWMQYYRFHIHGFKDVNSFEILKMVL